MNKRFCYLLLETVRDPHTGGYIPCIATEGESGYNSTNWDYGQDKAVAAQGVAQKNRGLGLTEAEVLEIIGSTF